MTRRRVIPQVPGPGQPRGAFDAAVKENIDIITGQRGRIELLPADAPLADVIAKVNELINRVQG